MAVTVNWTIDVGDDETLVFEYPAGVDISGNTYTAEIRSATLGNTPHDATTLKATCSCSIDGQDVTVALTDTQTRALADETVDLFWALRETLADGTTDVPFAGAVILNRTAVQ